jgi:hypothetical protein
MVFSAMASGLPVIDVQRKVRTCEYDADPDIPRSLALRQKHKTLQNEVGRLREFFSHIHDVFEAEAELMYRQLRSASAPQHLDCVIETPAFSSIQNLPTSGIEDLESDILASNAIRVYARPWTTLASNDLVSELISAFFTHDHCSRIPFVDQVCFLNDIQAGDISKANFCSPFLVNAICALRCVSSHTQRHASSLTKGVIAYVRASQGFWSNRRRGHF